MHTSVVTVTISKHICYFTRRFSGSAKHIPRCSLKGGIHNLVQYAFLQRLRISISREQALFDVARCTKRVSSFAFFRSFSDTTPIVDIENLQDTLY